MSRYRRLRVWQSAMDLAQAIYGCVDRFPTHQRFVLANQMQRAAVSIPSNIAEGYGRTHRGDYLRFLSIALGSLSELETQLILAARLKFLPREQAAALWQQCEITGRMLTAMIQKLKNSPDNSPD